MKRKIRHDPSAAFQAARKRETAALRELKEKNQKIEALDLALREMTKYAEETTKELNNLRDAFERHKQITKSAVGNALDFRQQRDQIELINGMVKIITGQDWREVDVRTS